MSRPINAARAALVLALLAATAPAQAYIFFTCRGPDGQRVYNDAGCARQPQTVPEAAAPEPETEPEPEELPAPAAAAPEAPAAEAHGAVLAAEPVPAAPAPPGVPTAAATPVTAVTAIAAALPPEPLSTSPPPARRTALVLSLSLVLLCWLWLTVQGFRRGPLWGWSLLLLSPPAMLAYGLRHPRPAAPGLALALAGAALAGVLYVRPIDQIAVADSHLSDAPGTHLATQRKPRLRFASGDTVYYKTTLDWDDPWLRGTHRVRWVWISGRQPPVESALPVRFAQPPLQLQGWMHAAELGRGTHAVQIYVDDRLLDQRRFEIRR